MLDLAMTMWRPVSGRTRSGLMMAMIFLSMMLRPGLRAMMRCMAAPVMIASWALVATTSFMVTLGAIPSAAALEMIFWLGMRVQLAESFLPPIIA